MPLGLLRAEHPPGVLAPKGAGSCLGPQHEAQLLVESWPNGAQ